MGRRAKVMVLAVLVSVLGACAGGPPPEQAAPATPAVAGSGAGFPLKPEEACGLLADKGLRTVGGYAATGAGVFLCSSFEKVIPAGEPIPDTLKFLALGTPQAVTELRVELALKSPGDVQVALRLLYEAVEALAQRALGAQVPEAAQVAIRSGVIGSWPVGRATLTLDESSGFGRTLRATLR